MEIRIRHDTLLILQVFGRTAQNMFDLLRPNLVKAKKSSTSEADAVYVMDADLVWEIRPNVQMFLWKGLVVSVFL